MVHGWWDICGGRSRSPFEDDRKKSKGNCNGKSLDAKFAKLARSFAKWFVVDVRMVGERWDEEIWEWLDRLW